LYNKKQEKQAGKSDKMSTMQRDLQKVEKMHDFTEF